MAARHTRTLWDNIWVRVAVAMVLVVIGLAPVGAATLSSPPVAASAEDIIAPPAEPQSAFIYNWTVYPEGHTEVSRTADSGARWQELSVIPEKVQGFAFGDPLGHDVLVLGERNIWTLTGEGEETGWEALSQSSSRPLSMAQSRNGTLYVGTESLGLFQSADRGQTWKAIEGLPASGAVAPVAVTAVTLHPEDERIIYAAAGYWLGTSQAHLAPEGTYMSVDAGSNWFLVSPATLGSEPVVQLIADYRQPLAMTEVSAESVRDVQLVVNSDLVIGLEDGSASRRASVAKVIGLSGNAVFVPQLMDKLNDPDYAAGIEIATAIGKLAGEGTLPALLAALDSPQETLRYRAALALGIMKAETAVPSLGRLLYDKSPQVPRMAAEALVAIRTPEAVAELLGPMSDAESTSARQAAMAALETLGEPAMGALVFLLREGNEVTRRNSAAMLGRIASPSAVPALAEALKDSSPAVQREAAWSLGYIPTPAGQVALRQALQDTRGDPVTQQVVVYALEGMETTVGGVSPAAAGGVSLDQILAHVSLGRWTFLAFALMLALVLVVMGMPLRLIFGRRRGLVVRELGEVRQARSTVS